MAEEDSEPPPRFEVRPCEDAYAVWDCQLDRWSSGPESRNAACLVMNDQESEHRAATVYPAKQNRESREERMFGPEYTKINTLFKRDERNVIVPGDWTTREFAYLKDCPWRWTEKVDGTNIRLHWNGSTVAVGGRTDSAQIPTFLIATLQPYLDPTVWAATFPDSDDVTVYGEGYGPKIQKGAQYRSDPALILFDVLVGRWWLELENLYDVAQKLGLHVVPNCDEWTLKEAANIVRDQKLSSNWPGAQIEGLVGRPTIDLFDRKGERIIAKIKRKDFADLERRGGKP